MDRQNPLRVLVTGATGFLGGNVLRALQAFPGVWPIAACRDRHRLSGFSGEVRAGDIMDSGYRHDVVQQIDVVCNAAAWASMWSHDTLERQRFYEPTRDLIDQAIAAGVQRFIQASTVVIGKVTQHGGAHDDFSPTPHTGFWPHLDRLVDIDRYMKAKAGQKTQMITLRLGHFVGRGNRLGMLPALVPRLRTYLVPWLGGGRKRLPLVADTDLGRGFSLAAVAKDLNDYESFNICGATFPTLRDVIEFIARETGFPKPLYSVPYSAGYAFGWLMETLKPLLPGSSPFLTRSIVHLCEDWVCPNDYASKKLGYVPEKNWESAVREHVADLKAAGFPWPPLAQAA